MAEEIDDLKKLSPKERIERLKKLQEKNKEEIEEAQKMLTVAEEEAEIQDELKDIPIPQMKAVDIGALFSPEEKELFKAKRFEGGEPVTVEEEKRPEKKKSELEDIAATAPKLSPEEEQHHIEYLNQLSQKPAEQLTNRAKELYSEFKEHGYLSPDKQSEMQNIEYANQRKFEAAEAGKYKDVSKEVAEDMVLIEKMKNAMTYQR